MRLRIVKCSRLKYNIFKIQQEEMGNSMDKDMERLMNQLKKGISITCHIGRNDCTLEGYNLMEAIDILGADGGNAKSKETLSQLFFAQLKKKVENTGLDGRVLVNSADTIEFHYEEIYNKLFAFDLIEFCYNVHDDVDKIKLTRAGLELYKQWKRIA